MAVTSTLLPILNSLSTDDRQVLLTIDVPSTKEFQVIGSLTVDKTRVTRRLPFDLEDNKLADWEAKIGIVFHRFLRARKVNISYTNDEGYQTTLDSDEHLEAAFKSHQQRLSAEKISSPLLQLDLEVEEILASPTPIVEQEYEDKDMIVCNDCRGTVTTGLGYKCLHCNSVHICANCRPLSSKHSDHILISCLVLTTFARNWE